MSVKKPIGDTTLSDEIFQTFPLILGIKHGGLQQLHPLNIFWGCDKTRKKSK